MKVLKILLIVILYVLTTALRPDAARIAPHYGWDAWNGKTRQMYWCRLKSYDFPSLALPTNTVATRVTRMEDEGFRRLMVWSETNQSEQLRIDLLTRPGVREAHESLLGHLANCAIDHSKNVKDIGDRGYGIERADSGFALFTRNNVLVYVGSALSACPAEVIARQIDADILWRSTWLGLCRWVLYGLIGGGLLFCAVRIIRRRLQRMPGDAGGKEAKRLSRWGRHRRAILGCAFALVLAVTLFSNYGQRAIWRLVCEVGRRAVERPASSAARQDVKRPMPTRRRYVPKRDGHVLQKERPKVDYPHNVVVRIKSIENSLPLEPIARQIDADILQKSMSHE